MPRRLFFAMTLLILGCGGSSGPRPNVILILVDTLRADHLSTYGYDLPTAVGLDAFARDATRFESCYAPAPWTSPSVASLMTGMFTARHRTNAHGARLPGEILTLPELLQQNGWHTAGWSFNPEVSTVTGFDQGFDEWDGYLGDATHYLDITEMLARVSRWLDDAPEQPFFLYLQPMNCHGPYRVPARGQARLLGRPPSDRFRYYGPEMKAVLDARDYSGVDDALVQSMVEQYDTAIRWSTDQIGRFLQNLRERGLYDDALIIITADHGEELQEHGGFSHGYSFYEEVLHVPLLVKLPGQTKSRIVTERVSLTDLYPTLVDLLELDVPQLLDGRSLAAALRGAPGEGSGPLRTRLHQSRWTQRCNGRAIVSGKYKLIDLERDWTNPEPRKLLFDLELDPGEKRDLAASRPDVVRRLESQLDDHFSHYKSLAFDAPENVLDQMDQERLKALGYLDD